MNINNIYETLKQSQHKNAIIYQDRAYTYGWLCDRVSEMRITLNQQYKAGTVVQLLADYSPNAVAALIALILNKHVVSPLTRLTEAKRAEYEDIIDVEAIVHINAEDVISMKNTNRICNHDLIAELRNRNHAGLIILSSGSSGDSKAIVHDMESLLGNISCNGKSYSTIAFLSFDHIGGLNTLFQTLFNGGTIVVSDNRTAKAVCESIEKHKVNALVTSPSFLNLLQLSQPVDQYDLSSLKIINYGSEPMPEFLLKKLVGIFPAVRFSQAYGMSELGVLKVKSKSSDSLLIQVTDQTSAIRIRDGLLEIKSNSSMLGYINSPSPFTEDGWLKTGDRVELDGEYIKILGRESEIINIGGEKVYPAEIENVLMQVEGVEDAVVVGEPNAILGKIVKAKIKLKDNLSIVDIKKKLLAYCALKLPLFKIPQKIEIIEQFTFNDRFKKSRKQFI